MWNRLRHCSEGDKVQLYEPLPFKRVSFEDRKLEPEVFTICPDSTNINGGNHRLLMNQDGGTVWWSDEWPCELARTDVH
jgi:hypothetical protein